MVSSAVPSTNVIPPTPTGSAGSTGRSSDPSNNCSIHSTLSSFVSAPMFNKLGLLGKITGRSSDDKETWTQWGARNLGALGGWTMHQLVCAGVSRELGELAGRLAMEKAKENPLVAVGLGTCLTAGYALRGAKALYKLATETKEESDLLNAIELSSTDPTKFSPEELAAAGRRRKFAVVAATAVNLAAGAGMAYLGYERHLDASRGAFLETVTNLVTRSHVYAIFRDGLQGMFGLVDGGSLPPTQAETRLPAAIYVFEQIIGGVTMDYVSAAISNPLYKVAARSAINAFIEALDNFQLSAVTGGKAAEESDKGIQELQHWNPTAGLTKNIFHKLFDQSITREALLHVVNASFVGIALLSEMNDKTKSPEAGVNLLQSLFINTLGAGVIGLLYGPIVSTWFWQGTQRNLDREALKRKMDDLEKASAGSGTGSGSATPPGELQGVTVDTNPREDTQADGKPPADALAGAVRPGEMTGQQEREWRIRHREQQPLSLSAMADKLKQALRDLSSESDSDTRTEARNPDNESAKKELVDAVNNLVARMENFVVAKAAGDDGAGTQYTHDAEAESKLLEEAEEMAQTIQSAVVLDAFWNRNASPLDVTKLIRAGSPLSDLLLNGSNSSRTNSDADITDNRSEVSKEGDEPDARKMANMVSLLLDGFPEIDLSPVGSASDVHAADEEDSASDADQPEQLPNAERVPDAGALNHGEIDPEALAQEMAMGMENLLTPPLPELGDDLPEMPDTDNVAAPSVEDEQAITDVEATTSSAVASEPEAASVIRSANEEDPGSDEDLDLQMLEVDDDSDAELGVGKGDASDIEELEGEDDAAVPLLETGDGHGADAPSVEDEQAITDAETRDVRNASLPTNSPDVATDITSEREPTPTPRLNAEPQTGTPMAEQTQPIQWNGNPISAKVYTEYEVESGPANRATTNLAETYGINFDSFDKSEINPATFASFKVADWLPPSQSGSANRPEKPKWSPRNLFKKTTATTTSSTDQAKTEDDRRGKGNKFTGFFKKVPNPFKKMKGASTERSQSVQTAASSASPNPKQSVPSSNKGKGRAKD